MNMNCALRISLITVMLGYLPLPIAAVNTPSIPDTHAPMTARSALVLPIPEINVDGIAFSRVIDYFRNLSGANIVVDWKILEAAGVSKDTPVTLQVRNLSLKKMLELALDQASPSTQLVFSVDQNVIEITTRDDADSKMVTRVYDVNELVMPLQSDVLPPTLDINASFSQGSASGSSGGTSVFGAQGSGQISADTKEKRGQDLATVIRTTVRPNIWRENGGQASIQYLMGQLIVTAPVSVQEAIDGPPRNTTDRYGM